ncbi:MAG: hypothetical protein KGJ86_17430, partial [Chloroflexota bacterium]|nr:hypothetical protein [Chloroflexota bacterium]
EPTRRSAPAPSRRLAGIRPRRRRFSAPDRQGDGSPPPDDDTARWLKEHPQSERHLQWPYFLILAMPWLLWTLGIVLTHFGICVLCVTGGDVSLPFP